VPLPRPGASGGGRGTRNSWSASDGNFDGGVYLSLNAMTGNDRGARVERIPLSAVPSRRFPSRSPATDEDIRRLAASIRSLGLIQPILVRPLGKEYEVVSGQRRYQACKVLGLADIVAVVRTLDDREAFEISVAENARRDA